MKKSFEEVLGLSADEFACYFNSQVAAILGRVEAESTLTAVEANIIKEIRRDLYEKLKKARNPKLSFSIKEIYSFLEEAHIDFAKHTLNSADSTMGADSTVLTSFPSLNENAFLRIFSCLSIREKGCLLTASKPLSAVLKDNLRKTKFLLHVARGQQAEADEMLRADTNLLTRTGEFTDYSRRSFNCTAYEYAYWAKDTHMCRMLERYMDENVKAFLRKRIDSLESVDSVTGQAKGLVYWQKGIKHQSAHFDLTVLKATMRQYIADRNDPERGRMFSHLEECWKKVGEAQREVPAHVAHEYCRGDRSFDPIPNFKEASLPRGLTFFHHERDLEISLLWFPLDFFVPLRRFGYHVSGIYRGVGRPLGGGLPYYEAADIVQSDLMAISRLDEVRTAELEESRKHLEPAATAVGLSR